MDEVQKSLVDEYRHSHRGDDYIESLSDEEILPMCAPTMYDYMGYYDEQLTPLLDAFNKAQEELREDEEFSKQPNLTLVQKEVVNEDLKSDRAVLAELNEKIIKLKEEKAARLAKFAPPER